MQEPTAAIQLQPELILSSRAWYKNAPLLYLGSTAGSREEGIDSLAVLVEEAVQTPLVPGLSWGIPVRVHRVLDNRLLGESSAASLEAFIGALKELLAAGQIEFVLFHDLAVDSPFRPLMANADGRQEVAVWQPGEPLPHWWIRFPEKPEEYWSQFSGKTRYNFRYRAKRLQHSVVSVREPDQVASFLAKAHQVSRQTWQFRDLGGGITSGPEEQAFWERVAAMGAMRSFLMEQEGKPLAFFAGIQWKECLRCEKAGYDPAYAAFSPGQVLFSRVIEDLIARDTPPLFDLGYGHSELLKMFANSQTQSGHIILVGRSWRAKALLGLTSIQQTLARRGGPLLRRLGRLLAVRRVRH